MAVTRVDVLGYDRKYDVTILTHIFISSQRPCEML
jgi:hypothetical protein